MRGLLRDLACGPALWGKLLGWKRTVTPVRVAYGPDKAQYFLDFAPAPEKDRGLVVVYIHGGGWDKGSPAALYLPETGKDSHSDYVVGSFLEEREKSGTIDKLFRWLEELAQKAGEPSGPENV